MATGEPGDLAGGRDRVPDDLVSRAKAAFRGRANAERLAALESDSLVDDAGGSPRDHSLRFAHPTVQVTLHVSGGQGRSELQGRIDPPRAGTVELDGPEAGVAAASATNEAGEFTFSGVPHGTVRLRLFGDGPEEIHTDWFRL